MLLLRNKNKNILMVQIRSINKIWALTCWKSQFSPWGKTKRSIHTKHLPLDPIPKLVWLSSKKLKPWTSHPYVGDFARCSLKYNCKPISFWHFKCIITSPNILSVPIWQSFCASLLDLSNKIGLIGFFLTVCWFCTTSLRSGINHWNSSD